MSRVEALPGVDEKEQARVTPPSHNFLGTGLTLAGETQSRQFEFNVVSPGFFTMLGMPMVRGRTFTEAETGSDAPVLVVTESTARRLWPGQEAIGKTLRAWEKKAEIRRPRTSDRLTGCFFTCRRARRNIPARRAVRVDPVVALRYE